MSHVVRPGLPDPAPEFVAQFRKATDRITLDPDNKRWLDQLYSNKINSALHKFCAVPELDSALQSQYQTYFPHHTITCWAGIMRPADDQPACLPPHVDRGRALAINYILDTGGDCVSTLLYDRVMPVTAQSTNLQYGEVGVISQHIFEPGWVAYGVNRCHSVERITGARLILIIFLATAPAGYDLSDFQRDYPDLLDN